MSCRASVDPYNNFPEGKKKPKAKWNEQYGGPPQQVQQHPLPQQSQGRIDPSTENRLLKQDLDVAIGYIRTLGGTWPPPGH